MRNQGVTLVELLVVIAIITLIGFTVLASISQLGASAKVNATANQIVDVIKKTRHDSVSVKEFGVNLFPSYGVYFNTTSDKIIIYADCIADETGDDLIDNNDTFHYVPMSPTCAGGDLVKELVMSSGIKIKEIRSVSISDSEPYDLNEKTENWVHIEFMRPDPTTWITLDDDESIISGGRIEIDVTDANEKYKKTIILWSNGQVLLTNFKP